MRSGLRLRYLRRAADILQPPVPRRGRQEIIADAFSARDLRFRIRSGETERLMTGPTERESLLDSVCLDGFRELHVVPLVVLFYPLFAA